MNTILKLFSIDMLLEFVGQWLAGTIKNQDSAKAQKVIEAVRKLHRICGAFLSRFDKSSGSGSFPFERNALDE